MKIKPSRIIVFLLIPFLTFSSRTSENLEESVKKSSILGTGIISSVRKDERIVFTADHFNGYKECYVTAATDLDRLEEFKRCAGINDT